MTHDRKTFKLAVATVRLQFQSPSPVIMTCGDGYGRYMGTFSTAWENLEFTAHRVKMCESPIATYYSTSNQNIMNLKLLS